MEDREPTGALDMNELLDILLEMSAFEWVVGLTGLAMLLCASWQFGGTIAAFIG